MNKLTFYEQVGIVIPGSVFLFGLLLFFPILQTVLTKDGVSLGDCTGVVCRGTPYRGGWKCHCKLLVAPCRWDAIGLDNENANIAAIRAAN